MSNSIVILTALEVERKAVEKHLINLSTVTHPITGTDYAKGVFQTPTRDVDIIVGRTDQTNVNAALETERALDHFDPDYIFYVGIAGGLKDVNVGDIVIGTEVLGYERGKAEETSFKPRPQFGASSYDIDRLANTVAKSNNWKEIASFLYDQEFSKEIKVLSGTIASGEKVDASYSSDLHKHIKQNASHALAIEMEGLGFLTVCRSRPAVKSLLIRGISDLVNDKGQMDGKGSQPYASQNVSAFLFEIIKELEISEVREEKPENQVVEIMCKLYPRGIEDQGVWVRAGGDLSLVRLNSTGKGQWVESIRLIKHGGHVSLDSLVETALEDFPKNVDLEKLT